MYALSELVPYASDASIDLLFGPAPEDLVDLCHSYVQAAFLVGLTPASKTRNVSVTSDPDRGPLFCRISVASYVVPNVVVGLLTGEVFVLNSRDRSPFEPLSTAAARLSLTTWRRSLLRDLLHDVCLARRQERGLLELQVAHTDVMRGC